MTFARVFFGLVGDSLARRWHGIPAWLLYLDAQLLTSLVAPVLGVLVGWVALAAFLGRPAAHALAITGREHQTRREASSVPVATEKRQRTLPFAGARQLALPPAIDSDNQGLRAVDHQEDQL